MTIVREAFYSDLKVLSVPARRLQRRHAGPTWIASTMLQRGWERRFPAAVIFYTPSAKSDSSILFLKLNINVP
jgi:hypothetical protein